MNTPEADIAAIRRFIDGGRLPMAVDANPMAQALGMALHSVDEVRGNVELGFEPCASFLQGTGVLQGGALVYCSDRRPHGLASDVEVASLPDKVNPGKIDMAAAMQDLAKRGVNELHVEAGHKLNGSLVREGLVDEFLVYMAPRLLGTGRELAAFGPLERLEDTLDLRYVSVERVGDDLRLIARPPGRERF